MKVVLSICYGALRLCVDGNSPKPVLTRRVPGRHVFSGNWGQLLGAVLLATTLAGCASKSVKTRVPDGVATQVFEWGSWSRTCKASAFTIQISQGPNFGVADIGTGSMIIGKKSATSTDTACEGETVETQVVNYTARQGFKGIDKFRLSVLSPYADPRHFDMEVTVD